MLYRPKQKSTTQNGKIESIAISVREGVAASRSLKSSKGFSMTELLVVIGIIALLSVMSLPYIVSYRKVYRSEDQAIKIIDLMTETSQLALTRRRTMRLEIDLTDNAVKIIDEQGTDPDTLIKSIPMDNTLDLRVDAKPNGVSKPDPPNYADVAFATDTLGHLEGATPVTGHSVWAARFQRDGSVVNGIGNPISVNIYIWPPTTAGSMDPRDLREVRAITLFGGSGAIRLWKHNGTALVAS